MKITIINILLLFFVCSTYTNAEDRKLVEDHRKLKQMLIEAQAAINDKNIDEILPYLHPDAFLVLQNGEVLKGEKELKAFFDRVMKGPSSILESHSVVAEEAEPAWIYGDTAVAYGTSVDTFDFRGGEVFEVESRWTTTLLRHEGQWKVVSLQFTTDVFDNPLLNKARNSLFLASGVGAACGVGSVGLLFLLVRLKRKYY